MKLIKIFSYLVTFQILIACNFGAGTLGGFDPVVFSTSKIKLKEAVDSVFAQYPQYIIPKKWDYLNNWKARGYDFLESEIFYFNDSPEEMYYVAYLSDPDSNTVEISIRAINNGGNYWFLRKDLNEFESKRITKRFNSEIVKKLNYYLNKK